MSVLPLLDLDGDFLAPASIRKKKKRESHRRQQHGGGGNITVVTVESQRDCLARGGEVEKDLRTIK